MYRGIDFQKSQNSFIRRQQSEREQLAYQKRKEIQFEDTSDEEDSLSVKKKRDRDMQLVDWIEYANCLERALQRAKQRKQELKSDNYVLFESIREKDRIMHRLARENRDLYSTRLVVIKEEENAQQQQRPDLSMSYSSNSRSVLKTYPDEELRENLRYGSATQRIRTHQNSNYGQRLSLLQGKNQNYQVQRPMEQHRISDNQVIMIKVPNKQFAASATSSSTSLPQPEEDVSANQYPNGKGVQGRPRSRTQTSFPRPQNGAVQVLVPAKQQEAIALQQDIQIDIKQKTPVTTSNDQVLPNLALMQAVVTPLLPTNEKMRTSGSFRLRQLAPEHSTALVQPFSATLTNFPSSYSYSRLM